jgi:hypothetical protein
MTAKEVDWADVMRDWSEEDVLFLRAVCDAKLRRMPRRITLIMADSPQIINEG